MRRKGFAARLRQAREARSLSLTQLGRLVGVSPTSPWQWENDDTRPPSAENLALVAQLLGVDPEWLRHGDPPNIASFSTTDLVNELRARGLTVTISVPRKSAAGASN